MKPLSRPDQRTIDEGNVSQHEVLTLYEGSAVPRHYQNAHQRLRSNTSSAEVREN